MRNKTTGTARITADWNKKIALGVIRPFPSSKRPRMAWAVGKTARSGLQKLILFLP
jgi:hypothetical protein